MISIDTIKQNFFPEKINAIRHSEYEFLFRDTIEFILEQHQKLSTEITDNTITDLLFPLAYHPDFILSPESINHSQYSDYLNQFTPPHKPSRPETKIINHPEEETDLVRILFQRFTTSSYETIIERQKMFTLEQKENIQSQYFILNQSFPELDFLSYTFEAALDFNSLQKLKKHSFQAFITLPIIPTHGYYTPETIINSGLLSTYVMTMKKTLDAFYKISGELSTHACYLLPIAFNHKVIFTININQLLKINSPLIDELWPLVKKATPTIYHNIQKLKQNYETQ